MKNLTGRSQIVALVLALFICPNFLFAQKGAIIVGGSLGWSSNGSTVEYVPNASLKGNSSSSFTLAPGVIYMFGDKMGVGLSLGYSTESSKSYSYGAGNSFIDRIDYASMGKFTITPSFRYLFANFDKITLYGDLMIPISFGSGNDYRDVITNSGAVTTTPKYKDSSNGFGIVFQPGIAYSLTNKITLFASVFHMNFYSSESVENENDPNDPNDNVIRKTTTSNGLVNMIDPHFMIGFNYAF